MDCIKYPDFNVRTINSNITTDNFFKQDYVVYSTDDEYLFTIYRKFVNKYTAEGLCSGNTEECIAAIKTYLEHVKYHMNSIVDKTSTVQYK